MILNLAVPYVPTAPQLREMVNMAREYVLAMSLELKRRETSDPARSMELAAYFTHCQLHRAHMSLCLRLLSPPYFCVEGAGCVLDA